MALFSPMTPCALCQKPIAEVKEAIGFAALLPMESEFADFYDTCAHSRCLKAWPRRDAFVIYYNGLVEMSAPGRVSQLAVTAEGDVVHELDQWRDGI